MSESALPAIPEIPPAEREQLKERFSAETPDEIRERVLAAVFAVLDGVDDDE